MTLDEELTAFYWRYNADISVYEFEAEAGVRCISLHSKVSKPEDILLGDVNINERRVSNGIIIRAYTSDLEYLVERGLLTDYLDQCANELINGETS